MNLALYDCDVLVVTGTSYFLWVMDNLKEISAEVARIWEEDHKKEEEEEGQEDRSRQETDTIGSDSKCCELEYHKVSPTRSRKVHVHSILHSAFQLSDRVSDIDRKIVMVSDKLNLMVENQEKLVKIHSKYRYRALIVITSRTFIQNILMMRGEV